MLQAKEQKANVVNLPVKALVERTKKKRSIKSTRLNATKILVGIFIAFLVYSFGGQYIKMHNLQEEIQVLNVQMNEYKSNNIKLEKDIKRMESDVYVERMAREKLGLIKAGEVPITEAKAAEGNLVEKSKTDDNNNVH